MRLQSQTATSALRSWECRCLWSESPYPKNASPLLTSLSVGRDVFHNTSMLLSALFFRGEPDRSWSGEAVHSHRCYKRHRQLAQLLETYPLVAFPAKVGQTDTEARAHHATVSPRRYTAVRREWRLQQFGPRPPPNPTPRSGTGFRG